MKTTYSNIFIHAWNTVLESFSSKHILDAAIHPPQGCRSNRDILVSMGIVGDISGQVYLSMDAKTGQMIASEMLGGMEISEVNELVISAVGEMCNMIMGNACSDISTEHISNVDITPPVVIADGDLPPFSVRPLYHISFMLEDSNSIDFDVALQTA